MKRKVLLIIAGVVIALAAGFLIYTGIYYRADATAIAALQSDEQVTVTQTSYGWYFDGPSQEYGLVFYPGAKVEETAYAPFLHTLSARGIDVCVMKMPLRLAILGVNKAEEAIGQYDYIHWYIGGHSMGGAAAAINASNHAGQYEGIILCGAYATQTLPAGMKAILLCGSEDHVVNWEKVEEGRGFVPADYTEHIINGGNHAQFGNYGAQRGDGQASLSAEEQQKEAADVILAAIFK